MRWSVLNIPFSLIMFMVRKKKKRLEGKTMRDYFPNVLERKYAPWKGVYYKIRRDRASREALREAEKKFKHDLVLDRIDDLEEGKLRPGSWYEGFRMTLIDCLSEYKFAQNIPPEKVSKEKRFITDPSKYSDDILHSQMRKHLVDPVQPSKEKLSVLVKGVVEEVRKTLGKDAANKVKSYLTDKFGV